MSMAGEAGLKAVLRVPLIPIIFALLLFSTELFETVWRSKEQAQSVLSQSQAGASETMPDVALQSRSLCLVQYAVEAGGMESVCRLSAAARRAARSFREAKARLMLLELLLFISLTILVSRILYACLPGVFVLPVSHKIVLFFHAKDGMK